MSVNFHRDYTLIVGKPARENNFIIPRSIESPKLVENGTTPSGVSLPSGDRLDYNTIPATNWEISGVQLKARIGQMKANSNPCEIYVINGPEEVFKNITKDDLVILKAGYRNSSGSQVSSPDRKRDLPDLFVGQITQIVSYQEGVDRVTRILGAEAITITKNVHISKSYPPLTTRYEVLLDLIELAKGNGLPLGSFKLLDGTYERFIAETPYLTGLTVKGMLMETLENICEYIGLNCYTALGKLYIEPKSVPTKGTLFTADSSQVIGKVQLLSDNTTTSSNENGSLNSSGIQIKFWLEPRLSIEKLVRLKDLGEYSGDYTVTGIQHDLDYRSTSMWTTSVTLQRL